MIRWVLYASLVNLAFTINGQTFEFKTHYDQDETQIKEIITVNSSNNSLEGPYTKFHQNGQLAIQGTHNEGHPTGKWTYYYESGLRKSEGYFKNGKSDSTWIFFYENGNPKSKGVIDENKLSGKWAYYFEDGKIKHEGFYEAGNMVGIWNYFYENGVLKATTIYDGNEGYHTEYYPSGALKASGKKDQNTSIGEWAFYHEKDIIQSIGHFVNGKKEGEWKTYHKNGSLESAGSYLNGQKSGKWEYYHQDGSPLGSGVMMQDQMNGTWNMYFPDGTIQSSGSYVNGTGQVTDYFSNGQIASTGFLKEGIRDSIWFFYDLNGQLMGKAAYQNGNGIYEGYHPNGEIRISGTMKDALRVGEWKMYDETGKFTGTYHPIYDESPSPSAIEPEIIPADSILKYEASVSEYKYSKKEIRFFNPVVNEMKAWIIATNPAMTLLDKLPVSIERYKQERLGYELIYTWNRSPFFISRSQIGLHESYLNGHTFTLRQKFYSKEMPFGMLYFSHQAFGTFNMHQVKTQESGGFRQIYTSSMSENEVGYGLAVGWRWMLDAGEPGITFDAYLGVNIAKSTWNQQTIEDPAATLIFTELEGEPLSFPVSFGLNIGWAVTGDKKKKNKRRR